MNDFQTNAVREGRAELDAAKRLKAHGFTPQQVANLNESVMATLRSGGRSTPFLEAVRDEHRFLTRMWTKEPADLMPMGEAANQDHEGRLVRMVHEGLCPHCGRSAYLVDLRPPTSGDPLEAWDDRMETTVECVDGHRSIAVPHRNGDWYGWVVPPRVRVVEPKGPPMTRDELRQVVQRKMDDAVARFMDDVFPA